MQIAQFNIVPLEQAMANAEVQIGIENDQFVHSDNFEDFGYESSDVILNLQIMFIFILILVALPIFVVLFRLCCRRKKKCIKCLDAFGKRVFWSTYIRFMLESYLELALASILRLKNFSFVTGSDTFHSVVALVFLSVVTIFLSGSILFLLLNQSRLLQKDFNEKYGELTIGLKNRSNIDEKIALKVYTETILRRQKVEMTKYEKRGADFSMVVSPDFSDSKERRRMESIVKNKYEELLAESKTTFKFAMLYPVFFMIRRVIYSIILVFFLEYNYFQIQLVIA